MNTHGEAYGEIKPSPSNLERRGWIVKRERGMKPSQRFEHKTL
jgi:hypothetical protein